MSDAPFAAGTGESFGAGRSFCGVAHRRYDQARPGEVVILGAPFDWGASHRPGARFGPRRRSARPTTCRSTAAART